MMINPDKPMAKRLPPGTAAAFRLATDFVTVIKVSWRSAHCALIRDFAEIFLIFRVH